MRAPTNPVQELLRDAMGIDTFAVDGETGTVTESWQDDPHRRGKATE